MPRSLPAPLAESSYIPARFEWDAVRPGVDIFRFEDADLPLVYHVVRVDLTEPTVTLACVEGDVPSAAKDAGACVAFNATPFEQKFLVLKRLKGVCRIDGKEVSAPVQKYAALVFDLPLKDALKSTRGYVSLGGVDGGDGRPLQAVRARIVGEQTEDSLAGWKNACGGFFAVLRDGEVLPFKVQSFRARVGVGLTADGKTMYVLVVEENNSMGLSYGQCALLFKALGCSDAMEFDGGHSTALYVEGRNVLCARPGRSSLNALVVHSAVQRVGER